MVFGRRGGADGRAEAEWGRRRCGAGVEVPEEAVKH